MVVGMIAKRDDEERTQMELLDEIRILKKRIRDLERERDILLALHRRDTG